MGRDTKEREISCERVWVPVRFMIP
jgi:hypothetical protein